MFSAQHMIVILLATILEMTANADTCAKPDLDPLQHLNWADIAFEGLVVSLEDQSDVSQKGRIPHQKIQFLVGDVFKGEPGKFVEVHTYASTYLEAGQDIKPGEKMVVFAERNSHDAFEAFGCRMTRIIPTAAGTRDFTGEDMRKALESWDW